MKALFLGTPDFGVPILRALAERHEVVGVVTQPDRINARGKKLLPSPVKREAEALGLPLFQFERLSEGLDELEKTGAEIWISAAYGQILSRKALEIPLHGVWNVHASLLPKYRGASPVQSALLAGERMTGVTLMRTVYELDAGDIIAASVLPLEGGETAGEILAALSDAGATLLLRSLDELAAGKVKYTPQSVAEATYCGKLTKDGGRLNFAEEGAEQIKNRVRAYAPAPGAYCFTPYGRLKVFRAALARESGVPGEVLSGKGGLQIACKEGSVIFTEVQGENARRMSAEEFLRGKPIEVGTVLQ